MSAGHLPLRRALRDLWRAARRSPAARAAEVPSLRWPRGPEPLQPPSAPPGRFDEWASLQDLETSEARRLLAEEASASEAFFADSVDFEELLQAEAAHLLLPEERTAAEVHGAFSYFQRYTSDGFVVFCREPAAGGVQEVLLDTSELANAAGTGYADVTHCKVSDDHRILAYIVDVVGDESYELRFKTLGPSEGTWSLRVPDVRSVEFAGKALVESGGVDVLAVFADPQTRRSCRVSYLQVASEGLIKEQLLWEEDNEAAYMEVFRTKDLYSVLLSSNTKDTSEVRVFLCNGGEVATKALLARREGVEYFAEHCDGHFYVISNHERSDFSVYRLHERCPEAGNGGWSDLEPFFSPPGCFHVTDADMLRRWLVLYGHEAASPRICVVPLAPVGVDGASASSSSSYFAPLPQPVGSVEPGVNAQADADTIRFTFRSPLEPGSTYDLNLAAGEVQSVSSRQWSPYAGMSPDSFTCERIEYPARDGELVPLTLVRPRDDRISSVRPCLLQVYGAYGSCLAPDFRPEQIALLRRGWSVAWAHVRGGGERGRAWHIAGRQLKKAQSVYDLADAVRFLIARGIAAPGGLCLKASSAGGLTLGALLASAEDASFVSAAVLEVPFVDPLTGMLDPTLPLTVHEFAEWGDPRQKPHEENLRSLSPYENVGSHRYPPVYLSGAMADARVPPWMPLKLAARIRTRTPAYLNVPSDGAVRRRRTAHAASAASTDSHPFVIFHCLDGGHAGATDWAGRSEEFSRQITFFHKALGLKLQ